MNSKVTPKVSPTHQMVVFTLPRTHTNDCTPPEPPRQAPSNPFLSPSPQTVSPVATRVDTEASGVAQKWPPTLSPLDSVIAKPKEEKKMKKRRGRNKWGAVGEKLTGTWLLQDSALNLAATSGGGWTGTGCPNALEQFLSWEKRLNALPFYPLLCYLYTHAYLQPPSPTFLLS